jgi:hypothetical protein
MSFTNGDDTLLTAADVMRWREELSEAQHIIVDQQERAAKLLRKLEAAAVFMPAEEMPPGVRPGSGATVDKSATLYDAIVKVVLAAHNTPMSPKMIRNAIAHSPDADLLSSENYLYTAIKRAVDKDLLAREGKGYVPAF